jgi:DNA mismatch repair protein MutS2
MKPPMAKIHARVARDLQWDKIRARAVAHCQSEVGSALLAADRFLADAPAIQTEQRLVSEMKGVIASEGGPPPLRGVADLSPHLSRAARQGVLEGSELVAVADTLAAAHRTSQIVARHAVRAPLLAALVAELPGYEPLFEDLYATFEPDGRVRDDASPRLKELRQRIAHLHERLRTQVVEEMRRHDEEALLQDDFFTMREERYVLPVKAQYRSVVQGIVHGSSNTGQTVYIEPEALIATNNQLKVAEQEAERECWLIRKRATEQVAEAADGVRFTVELGARLDSIAARALFSAELGAAEPEIASEGALRLRQVRNPLLALQGTAVVPNDIAIADGFRVLIVTGPNTGGKTVTLSTVGFCVLMAQSGYHVPARADSRLPVFAAVHTAMSDAQSFEHGLSAFSGHVRLLTRILEETDEESLVLLDEVMVGTEPSQGSALAVAFLERFADKGAAVAVTTHYDRLKTLSYADPRFRNASVGLNATTLQPNFELTTGLPGASSPIAIAERMGLDPALVERARALVGEEALSLDRVVRDLAAEEQALKAERHAIEAERAALSRARRAQETAAERLRQDGQRLAREQVGEVLELARETQKGALGHATQGALRRRQACGGAGDRQTGRCHRGAGARRRAARSRRPPADHAQEDGDR